jgi:hypothetical protein
MRDRLQLNAAILKRLVSRFQCKVAIRPVMNPRDLAKAWPAIEQSRQEAREISPGGQQLPLVLWGWAREAWYV